MMRGVAPCCCNVQGMAVEVEDELGGGYRYMYGYSTTTVIDTVTQVATHPHSLEPSTGLNSKDLCGSYEEYGVE